MKGFSFKTNKRKKKKKRKRKEMPWDPAQLAMSDHSVTQVGRRHPTLEVGNGLPGLS